MTDISVLIVDDHVVTRQGIKTFLDGIDNITVVGEANNGKEAINMALKIQPDIILMDLHMPEMNGLDATKHIKEQQDVHVIAFTAYDNEEYILEITQSGASGYLLKESSPTKIVEAIQTVFNGDTYFDIKPSQVIVKEYLKTYKTPKNSFDVAQKSFSSDDKKEKLTSREIEVLKYIAEALNNQQIADHLGLSVRTVESHRQNLMEKLGIHSSTGLVRYAFLNNYTH